MTIEDKIEFDLYYVKNRSFKMDMAILCRTVANVLARREGDVYEKRYSRTREAEQD